MDRLQEIVQKTSLAGVSLLRFVAPREMITPAFAWEVNSLPSGLGRVDVEIPRVVDGYSSLANSAWFAMAKDLYVIDERREFLLAIEDDMGDLYWGQMCLAKEWDFIEVGPTLGVTGSRKGFPSFAAISLDGDSAIIGHSDDAFISFTGAARLKEIPVLRESATRLALHSPHLGKDAAFSARTWLGLDPSG
ncbi:hypothetical protein ABZ326_08235 [Streptomyces californicus]|uniref:hypothetical protein n=1 Tax=Streptomyces californicus TaxID=67351 RepID=UPI0034D95B24